MDGAGEIIRSGAATQLTELLKKFAGPAAEELGAILGDSVRVYRVKNLLRTTERTKRILQEAALPPNQIPSRLLLPILDTCSVEDDDDLQEKWAGLLASASQDADQLSPSFIETLKQLTPKEAKHLDFIFLEVSRIHKRTPTHSDSIPYQAFTDAWKSPKGATETYERLGLIRRDYSVKMENGGWRVNFNAKDNFNPEDMENTVGEIESALDDIEAEIEWKFLFTAYALRFLNACQGPGKEIAERPKGKKSQ